MRNFLVFNEAGNAVYFDHPDGRMISLPVHATQLIMQNEFQEGFETIHAGKAIVVFEKFDTMTFLIISDEGESEYFLRRQLYQLYDLILFAIGPTVWQDIVSNNFKSLQRYATRLNSLVEASRQLCAEEQGFAVQCVERVDINDEIRHKCIRSMEKVLAVSPHTRHVFLFVGSKLLLQCSRPKSFDVTNNDISILAIHCKSLETESVNPMRDNSDKYAQQVTMDHSPVHSAGRDHENSLRYSRSSTADDDADSFVSAMSEDASEIYFEDEYDPDAETDEALKKRIALSRRRKVSKGGPQHHCNHFHKHRHTTVVSSSRRLLAPSSSHAVLDYDSDNSNNRPSSGESDRPPYRRCSSMPNLCQREHWELELEALVQSKGKSCKNNNDDNNSSSSSNNPTTTNKASSSNNNSNSNNNNNNNSSSSSTNNSSMYQTATPMRIRSKRSSSSGSSSNGTAHVTHESPHQHRRSKKSQPTAAAAPAALTELRLVFFRNGGSTPFWLYTCQLEPTLKLLVVTESKPMDVEASISQDHDKGVEALKKEISAFTEFLVMKGRTHLTMMPFMTAFPGLIHFIIVDRTRNLMLAPTIVSLHHPVATSCAAESMQLLKKRIWQLIACGQRSLSRGFYSMLMKADGTQLSHRIWFEDIEGNELAVERPLPVQLLKTEGWGCDLSRRLFPHLKMVRVYEMFTMYVGGMSYRSISSLNRKLAARVIPELK